MANGDLLSVSIRLTGTLATFRIAGFGSGTVSFNASKPPTFTVVSQGYSGETLTTFTRTVNAVKIHDQDIDSGDLLLDIELDAPIFDDDKNATGGSGTNPTVAVESGWVTNTVGGVTTNATAHTSFAVTNYSTVHYPKAIARWASVPCQRYTSTWIEDVVAFAMYAEASYPFGISRVKFIIREAGASTDTAVINQDSPTNVSRMTSGFGPASSYRVWRATFNPSNRGDGNPFAKGAGTRRFKVFPRLGDESCVFDSSDTINSPTGSRSSEIEIDASNADGAGLLASVAYADSTSRVEGTQTGTFTDREFVEANNGSSIVVVKAIAPFSSGTLTFNFLDKEQLYTVAVSSLTGAPAVGDIMIREVSGTEARIGRVLKYTGSSSSGTVWYQLFANNQFVSSDPVSFKYRTAVGENFVSRCTGNIGTPSSYGSGSSIPSGSTLTGLSSGANLSGLGVVKENGNDTNPGTAAEPRKTLIGAIEKATALRLAELASNNPDGCTIYLKPGDYVAGPRTIDRAGATENGYWLKVTSSDSTRARLKGARDQGANPEGLGIRRIKLENLWISSPGAGDMFPIHSSQMDAVLWVDNCLITGNSCIASDGVWGGQWGGVYITRSECKENGLGPCINGTLVRDCKIIDIGGDLLSSARCVVNVEADLCNSSGNTVLHGDIAQYTATSFDNIILFNIYAKRAIERQPAPNNGGTANSSFKNVAIVNVMQVITGVNRQGGLGHPTISNILIWNNTTDADLEVCGSLTTSAENISIRSCFIERLTNGSTVIPHMTAWFRNNHYLNTSSGGLSSGYNSSTGSTRADLFQDESDPTSSNYYRPEIESALYSKVPTEEVLIGYDVFNDQYKNEGGAIVS